MLMKSLKKNQAGWTLIEFIMTLMIVSLIAMVAGPLLAAAVDLVGFQTDRKPLREEAHRVIQRMTYDIRRIQDETSVLTATATHFEFVDADGTEIDYEFDDYQSGPGIDNEIRRREGSGGTQYKISENVSDLTFTYLDGEDNAISSPTVGSGTVTDIKKIRVEVEVTIGSEVLTVRTMISPRNFVYDNALLN